MNKKLSRLLPHSVREMAEIIGIDLSMEIVKKFGGLRLHVPLPHHLTASHRISQLIGFGKAQDFALHFGGVTLSIPLCKSMLLESRNIEIRKKYDEGVSVSRIAEEFSITERTVYALLEGE